MATRLESIDFCCMIVFLGCKDQEQELLIIQFLKLQHMNRRRTDLLEVGESTLDVRKPTVRETTEKWHMIFHYLSLTSSSILLNSSKQAQQPAWASPLKNFPIAL